MEKIQEFKTVIIRILTGIKKEDFNNCVFYDGILEDSLEEAEELILK